MITTPGLFAVLRTAGSSLQSHPGHGPALPSLLGSFVVAAAITVVLIVIVLCVKYFVDPGETSPEHIKRRILK